MPEPVTLDALTVQIGGQPPKAATFKAVARPVPPPPGWIPSWTFATDVQVPSLGSISIAVDAVYDTGEHRHQTVSIIAIPAVMAPQAILEIQPSNPDHPADFDAADAQLIALGKPNPTPVVGGTFPSVDAMQEWKQVLPPPDEDYEDFNLVGATGWLLNPDYSDVDFPFDHPFGFDWEFSVALDQPADDTKRYTFLLTRGDQSCADEGMGNSLSQAIRLKMMPDPNDPNDKTPMLIPLGPDKLPSLLGVEIDSGLIPTTFTDGGVASGDRIAVFGRWIVDCGHQIPITDMNGKDVAPGLQAFRSEIHPPLLMATARVTTDSLVSGGPASPEVTRVMFTSRPYLVSQRFTIDTGNAYDDNAADDGPFVKHMANEVSKVNLLESIRIEAHPKIKSFPFRGDNLAHFIIRPPPQVHGIGHPLPGRLHVSFQFTIRSGCSVQVVSTGAESIDVFIVMNHAGYTPPPLPHRNNRPWPKSELEDLNSRAGDAYRWGEGISAVFQSVIGTGIIGIAAVEVILNRDIMSDEYDTTGVRAVNILDASHPVSAFADSIPVGQGVITNNNQPYPVFGWLEAKFVPPANV